MLKRCSLCVNREKDSNLSDEFIQIRIKSLNQIDFCRRIVGDDFRYPLTLTLIGYKTKITGVKVTIYNPIKKTDIGVFFIANNAEWSYSKKEFNMETQKEDIIEYSWLPQELKRNGYAKIIKRIKAICDYNGVPEIVYKDHNGQSYVDYLEAIVTNSKYNR